MKKAPGATKTAGESDFSWESSPSAADLLPAAGGSGPTGDAILSDCGSRSTYKSELIGRPRGWLSV
jgi:hypothetical protein